jgi:DNA-binding transcriptional LysR family regulator
MDLPRMRQVIAIHRLGSFAKAAEALGMSQPSLSRSISRIEDELKTRIFDRSASGSALTPVGELLLGRLERVVADTEALMRDAMLFAGGEGAQIRIGVSAALVGSFVRDLVVRAASAFPHMRLHVEIDNRDALISQLAARDLDLVFSLAGRDPVDLGLAVIRLAELDSVGVAGPSHPLAGQRRIPFETFSQHRYAGPPATLVTTFFNLSAAQMTPFYTSNDYAALLPLVLAGLATAVAPRHLVRSLLEAGRLVELDVLWDIDLSVVALTSRAAADTPVISALISHAQAVLATLQAPALAA